MLENQEEIEMFIAGLVLDPSSNSPIVILKDANNQMCLPIWIGIAEATAIASELKKVALSRPMTHDLMKNILDEFDAKVTRVIITALQENTFIANIEIRLGQQLKRIDARPSDALALAVRAQAPVFVARDVLQKAQVPLVFGQLSETEEEFELKEEDIQSEKQNFANIEKDKWGEILADMNPDDFKYKM